MQDRTHRRLLCRAAADAEYMEIHAMTVDGNKVTFKVKQSTKLGKVGLIFCDKFDLDWRAYRMLYDGRALSPDETFGFYDIREGGRIYIIKNETGC